QPEIVPKLAGRPEKGGSSRRFTVSDHFDPATFIERPNDVGRYGDATDLLDVAARDRLSVGNDGKRFKGGSRILWRALRIQALEVDLHGWPALKAPAGCQRCQFKTTVLPVVAQLTQQRPERRSVYFVSEKPAKFGQRQWLACT